MSRYLALASVCAVEEIEILMICMILFFRCPRGVALHLEMSMGNSPPGYSISYSFPSYLIYPHTHTHTHHGCKIHPILIPIRVSGPQLSAFRDRGSLSRRVSVLRAPAQMGRARGRARRGERRGGRSRA
jgi:hypothetical protein